MSLITTPDAGSIVVKENDGSIQPLGLSIQYIKQLSTLLHNRIGKLNAVYTQSMQTVAGGLAIYYISQSNKVRDYQAQEAPDAVTTRPVQIMINERKSIKYSFETLDLNQLGAKLEENGQITVDKSLVTNWASANARSTEAFMFAAWTKGVYTAINNDVTNTPIVDLAVFESDGTLDTSVANLRNTFWYPLRAALNTLQSKINSAGEYFGLNIEDFYLLVSPRAETLGLLSVTTLGGDASRQSLIDGNIVEIGGMKMMLHPYLGQNYAQGVLGQDEAFDFSAFEIILIHKEFYAYPLVPGAASTTIDPQSNNPIFLHKFILPNNYGDVLRPGLAIGFRLVNKTNVQTLEVQDIREKIKSLESQLTKSQLKSNVPVPKSSTQFFKETFDTTKSGRKQLDKKIKQEKKIVENIAKDDKKIAERKLKENIKQVKKADKQIKKVIKKENK